MILIKFSQTDNQGGALNPGEHIDNFGYNLALFRAIQNLSNNIAYET